MIYLFAGDDTKQKIKNYEKFINKESSGLEIFFINRNNFDFSQIESFYSSSGLFFVQCFVVLDGLCEREDCKEFLLANLSKMMDSTNSFVFVEGKLLKPILDSFKKARAEINYLELPKEKKEKFNNFLLANALGDRDKFHLWLYFRQAMDAGVGMEELTGVMFWKVKDMILKKNFSKFKKEELQSIGNKVSYLLPKARKEGRDDEAAFEQFLLEVF